MNGREAPRQHARSNVSGSESSPLRRFAVALTLVWVLISTNPSELSFRRYLARRRSAVQAIPDESAPGFRTAVPSVSHALKRVFDADPPANAVFEGLDCALFTLVRSVPEDEATTSYPTPAPVSAALAAAAAAAAAAVAPSHAYLGIAGVWLSVPNPARFFDGSTARRVLLAVQRALREVRDSLLDSVRSGVADGRGASGRGSGSRDRGSGIGGIGLIGGVDGLSLPARPWEGLMACFALAGGFWYVMPEAAARHLTLTWENVRHAGRWWTLVLFHLSHGGSVLRLSRTVAACNYLAPLLLKQRVLTLSGLYGVVLTAAAMSTALGMVVLGRRHNAGRRTALEIDGGGGCVYALLVAACLDASAGSPGALRPWPVRPFELLMFNIAFDALFLAGQKRISDYTAHTGAALGAWVYVACNR